MSESNKKPPIPKYGVYKKVKKDGVSKITLLKIYVNKVDAEARKVAEGKALSFDKNNVPDEAEYHVWKETPTTSDREENKRVKKPHRLKTNMKRNKRIFKLLDDDIISVIKDKFLVQEGPSDKIRLKTEKVKEKTEEFEKTETISKIEYENSETSNKFTIIKYVLSNSYDVKGKDDFFPEFLGHKGKIITETRYAIFSTIEEEGDDAKKGKKIHTYMALEGDGRSFIDFNKMDKTFAKKATLSKDGFIGFKKMKKSNLLTKNKTQNIVAKPIILRDYKYDKHYEKIDGFVATFKEGDKPQPKNITVNLGMEYTSFSNFEDILNEIEKQHELNMLKGEDVGSIKTFKALNQMAITDNKKTIKDLNHVMWDDIKNSFDNLETVWPLWFNDTPLRYDLIHRQLVQEDKAKANNTTKYHFEVKGKHDAVSNKIISDLIISEFNEINNYFLEAVFDKQENVRVPLFNCLSYSKDNMILGSNKTGKINGKPETKKYILYNGDWYVINKIMHKYINDKYKEIFENYGIDSQLPDWKKRKYIEKRQSYGIKRITEGFYNIEASMQPNMLCLDQKLIYLKGNDKVEFADLYNIDTGTLVAVKDGSVASGISHLVTQARSTLNLLKWDYKLGQENIETIHEQYKGNKQKLKYKTRQYSNDEEKKLLRQFETPIKTLILGIGSEKTFDESKAPHIPFLGRMGIVELFENYDILHGFELKISHIKITDKQVSLEELQNFQEEEDANIKTSSKKTTSRSKIPQKINEYMNTLCKIKNDLINKPLKNLINKPLKKCNAQDKSNIHNVEKFIDNDKTWNKKIKSKCEYSKWEMETKFKSLLNKNKKKPKRYMRKKTKFKIKNYSSF